MSNYFTKDLLNFLDWQPSAYFYNRPLLDSKPYQIIRADDGTKATIVFNALGVCPDDVKVFIEREHGEDFLTVQAESKHELTNRNYNVSGKFKLDSESVDRAEWSAENGLLQIEIMFKEPEPSRIKVTKK